jgi:hypothetical protein
MKIAVLGSYRRCTGQEWNLRHKEFFQLACEELGKALALNGHTLVIAQAADETADKYALAGFDKGGGGDRTTINPLSGLRTWGAAHIAAVIQADTVIIIGGAEGSYSAGLAAILARKPLIPIACFGGASQELLRNMQEPIPPIIKNTLSEIDPLECSDWLQTLTQGVTRLLDAYPRILIIHGRSNDRNKVKTLVDGAAKMFPSLPPSIILGRQAPRGKTVPELFEEVASRVDAAIAVVTPDDLGATAVDSRGEPIKAIDLAGLKPRARENVWVEVGWFWGRLGRDKFLILRKGEKVEIPSDLSAIIRYTYETDPYECSKEILDFLCKLRIGFASSE